MKVEQRDVAADGSVLALALIGALTEDFNGPTLAAAVQTLRLDLAGITRINSGGVRSWIQWLSAMAPTVQRHFDGCSFAVTQQATAIANFLPGVVHSFAVPYFCEACGKDELALVVPPTLPAEHRPCASCGAEAELDVPLDMLRSLVDSAAGVA